MNILFVFPNCQERVPVMPLGGVSRSHCNCQEHKNKIKKVEHEVTNHNQKGFHPCQCKKSKRR